MTPSMSSRRSRRMVKSGRIRSTPGCSSSGKSTPQSMTSRRPPYSKTVMLRPISPRPPRGVMRRAPSGSGGGGPSSGCGWLKSHSSPHAPHARSGHVARASFVLFYWSCVVRDGARCAVVLFTPAWRGSPLSEMYPTGRQILRQLLDFRVGGVDERQPDGTGGQAEAAQGGLRGDHALGAEEALEDGHQLLVDLGRLGDVAAEVRLQHGAQLWGDQVAGDADEADRADREQRQVERVVTGVPGEVGLRDDLGGGHGVALGVLVGDDPRVLGEAE